MSKRTVALALLVLALAGAGRAAAQSWEAPTFFSPRPHNELGFYLIDPDGGDLGFKVIWRQSGRIDLGVRGGMGGRSDHRTALVGAELSGSLVQRSASPILVSWQTGLGASFNDFTWLRVPLGLSVGFQLESPSFVVVPYVHPRVALDIFAFDNARGDEETDSELNLDVDFGAEVDLGTSWILRLGATLGDTDVVGVGLAYRIPRRVAAR